MKYQILLTTLLLLALSSPLSAQTKLRAVFGGVPTVEKTSGGVTVPAPTQELVGAPGNVKYNKRTTTLIIPRYANGSTHPAGQIDGWGVNSPIQGDIYGPSNGLDPFEIVATEDFDQTLKHWVHDSNPGQPAVLQPRASNISIFGKDDLGDHYSGSNSAVNDNPGQWNPAATHGDRETGLTMKGTSPWADNLSFYHIAGTCLVISSPSDQGLAGTGKPFDGGSPFYVTGMIRMGRAYRGISIDAVDCKFTASVDAAALRDWAIKVPAGSGAVQFGGVYHCYGVNSRPDLHAVTPAPCVWFESGAGGCWGGQWYVENSNRGMLLASSRNVIPFVHSWGCGYGNVLLTGQHNTIENCDIEVAAGQFSTNGAPGILIANQWSSVLAGRVQIPNNEVGIQISGTNAGKGATIRNLRLVTTAGGSGATGLKVQDTLNYATIEVQLDEWTVGGVGVDLLDGSTDRIGTGNLIRVQFDTEGGAMTPSEACELHGNWSTTDDAAGETNEVYINGVRYYRAGPT